MSEQHMERQMRNLRNDLTSTRMARSLQPHEKERMYRLNADYRLAENPDTARLLVREMHDMLSLPEKRKLAKLRDQLIELNMMCDSLSLPR
jgi:hypothetical protein